MMPRLAVCCVVLLGCAPLLATGCANRWAWKQAGQKQLRDVVDDDASFTQTPLAKTHAMSKPAEKGVAPAAATAPVASAKTKPAVADPPATARSPEDEALIDDTLARLRSLPNKPAEEVDALARELRDPKHPAPRLMLRQMNALARREQEAYQKQQATIAQASHEEPAESTTATAERLPAVEEPRLPAQPDNPPTVEELAPAEETEVSDAPAANNARRSLLDRVRRARGEQPAPAGGPIFGNKVSAGDRPRIDPNALAVAHIARKAAATEQEVPLAWDESLAASIVELERSLRDDELPPEEVSRLATSLRMLYLVAGRKEEALREKRGLSSEEQDYWRSQAHALGVLLDPTGTPVKGKRASLALRPLRDAVDALAAQATLDVKNVSLCKSVTIWGKYEAFDKYEFKPNQEVLLYFEVENFASAESAQGYSTEFATSYEIFDASGRRVAEQQFPLAQETCQNRRRDYFIRYHLHVPKSLAPGDYTLQLTCEDQKGHKFGQGTVKFKVAT